MPNPNKRTHTGRLTTGLVITTLALTAACAEGGPGSENQNITAAEAFLAYANANAGKGTADVGAGPNAFPTLDGLTPTRFTADPDSVIKIVDDLAQLFKGGNPDVPATQGSLARTNAACTMAAANDSLTGLELRDAGDLMQKILYEQEHVPAGSVGMSNQYIDNNIALTNLCTDALRRDAEATRDLFDKWAPSSGQPRPEDDMVGLVATEN